MQQESSHVERKVLIMGVGCSGAALVAEGRWGISHLFPRKIQCQENQD
jgi:hypothetical protein